MAHRKSTCQHGLATTLCKPCRAEYDRAYNERTLKEYKNYISGEGCAACGFNHPNALDVHHFATEYKRYGRSQSFVHNLQDLKADKAVILCANCHDLFHGAFGGKIKPFPLLDKEGTVDIILNERNPK